MNPEDKQRIDRERLAVLRTLLSTLQRWGTDGVIVGFSSPHVNRGLNAWIIEALLSWKRSDNEAHVKVRQAIIDLGEQITAQTSGHLERADLSERSDSLGSGPLAGDMYVYITGVAQLQVERTGR